VTALAAADSAPTTAQASPDGPAASRKRGWRRWRGLAAVAAFIVAGAVAIALLAPGNRPNPYLDPGNSLPTGASALFDLLGERGHQVNAVYSPGDALSAIGPASGSPSVTLLVTSPDLLTRSQLRALSGARADLVLAAPGPKATGILAAQLGLATLASNGSPRPVPAGCQLAAAVQAGSADFAGETFIPPPGASSCYLINGYPALVRFAAPRRTITVLGDGALLSNDLLAQQGNAALALNLLSQHRRIVWLTPEPAVVAAPAPAAPRAGSSGPALIPWTAWLVVFQLGIAVLLAAIWRARRFGPLITERLPVVVRASETIEGHGRLYQARRAAGRAGTQLRDAMLARLLPVLGLPTGASEAAVIQELAQRSAMGQDRIADLLYGPAPGSDADLVNLASGLDDLERQVRAR
jgi:hypothetical protein